MTRNIYRITFLIFLSLGLAGPAFANWMGGFELDHGATSYLGNSELARVTFDFKVTNANGVQFVIHGYKNGVSQPGHTWGGSLFYPVGTVGTHFNFLTFNSGTVEVDQYRIAMYDPVTSDLLMEMFLPVEYFFGPHAVNDIQMNFTSPSWIQNGNNLTINFAYQTNEAGGVRISARPFTGGSLTPGYGASGIPTSPVGTGTSVQSFTFPNVESDVDEIRISMWTSDYSAQLLEFFVPVDLHWGPNSISNITYDPPFPECLAWDQPVTVEFDYATSEPSGCHVWALGLDADQNTPSGQSYSGSNLEPTAGHLSRQFRILSNSGEGEYKYVSLIMNDSWGTTNLLELHIPVTYPYGPNVIQNVSFYPASPAVLDNSEHVDTAFDYVTVDPAGVRIYNYPYTYGAITQYYGVSGSVLYQGTGSATSFFTVSSGESLVNSAQMIMKEANGGVFVMECFVECDFTFGGVGGVTPVLDIPTTVGLALSQNYPNPFNPQTTIAFDLPKQVAVELRVFDLSGRLVKVLLDGEIMAAGHQETVWYGRDDAGRQVPSGTYFYRLEGGELSETKSMALVK